MSACCRFFVPPQNRRIAVFGQVDPVAGQSTLSSPSPLNHLTFDVFPKLSGSYRLSVAVVSGLQISLEEPRMTANPPRAPGKGGTWPSP
jgi:hypothetical protein